MSNRKVFAEELRAGFGVPARESDVIEGADALMASTVRRYRRAEHPPGAPQNLGG